VGNLQVGADGQLLTMGGRPVLGDAGPMAVPPGSDAQVATDGLVTARGAGDPLTGVGDVGRLKLVNPPTTDLVRGDDGLFRMREGLQPAEADPAVRLTTGVIEGSNVNPVEAMVEMIANARRFELQMKSITSANEGAQSANKLLAYG
jgi:flagellar basal-body rod protein FlgF